MTDPIADMLTRLRNAYAAGIKETTMPHSKAKEAIMAVLKKENYVAEFSVEDTKPAKTLKVKLRYVGKTPAISMIKRVSKPGRRRYTQAKDIKSTLAGYGVTIVSTNLGVMTDKEARVANVGGEVICKVY